MATATIPKRTVPCNTDPVPAHRRLLPALGTTVGSKWHVALTGLVILAFVIFHLLHYTFGLVAATAQTPQGPVNFLDLHESARAAAQGAGPIDPARGRHDVYAMTVYGFRNVWVSAVYI